MDRDRDDHQRCLLAMKIAVPDSSALDARRVGFTFEMSVLKQSLYES
jgi:hypothetical protein